MSQKQQIYDLLTKLNITYKGVEHVAVFNIEEMRQLNFPPSAKIPKNLFLRDAKGRRHFLVSVDCDQAVNLRELEEKLSSTKLSFASEERLLKYMDLTKGSVSPFGLVNDTNREVEFFLDENLRNCDTIGIHPNDNTATVFLTYDDLVAFMSAIGHEVNFISFP